MKVGKEEAVAMLMAVEMWARRDHQAEWNQWTAWLDHIARRVATIDGLTTTIVQPVGLSNRTPSLRCSGTGNGLGVSGDLVAQTLLEGDPRVALFAAAVDDPSRTGRHHYAVHAGGRRGEGRCRPAPGGPLESSQRCGVPPAAPAVDLTGQWDVRIAYAASTSTHTLSLRQRGNTLDGSHRGIS